MALPLDYRWIAVGKLSMRNRSNAPHYAPNFDLTDLINATSGRIAQGNIHRAYARNNRLMWCSHLEDDGDYYRLLLQVGDKNVSGFTFLDFQTLDSRDIDKEESEGSHYAAHILIRKTPDQHNRYLIMIEKVPGVYLSAVKDHLTWICNDQQYYKEVEDDEGNLKGFRPIFNIEGHQSRTIREALRTGALQDVEFISYEENHPDGLDEEGIIQEVIHEARWEVKRRVTEDQARNIFGSIRDFAQGFRRGDDDTQVFVRIKAENGQIKRTEVQHNGDEILEQAFVQNELVNDFDPPLSQRYDNFRGDMIMKMVEVANNLGE